MIPIAFPLPLHSRTEHFIAGSLNVLRVATLVIKNIDQVGAREIETHGKCDILLWGLSHSSD
jgi:hypothetical protein